MAELPGLFSATSNAASAPSRNEANVQAPTKSEEWQAEALSKQGWQSYRDGKLAEAANAFQRAVELNPKSIDAWNGLGWTQHSQSQSGGVAFGRALEIDPKNAIALNGMGWELWRLTANDLAADFWRRATEADPTATSPMSGLAQNAMEKNDFAEAVKWYEKWLTQEQKNAEAAKGLERAKEGQKAVDDAMPIALEFLKCVDENRLADAKRLTESGDYMVRDDQSNVKNWQSVPGTVPRPFPGFSTVKV